MISDSEARRVAREFRKELERGWPIDPTYYKFCVACREKVPFDGWTMHLRDPLHLARELERQEALLKKGPKRWQMEHWPLTKESGRWCEKCERVIMNQDWYAHLESHRTRIRRKAF